VNEKFKPIERRLKTLDEHLRHSENFKSYRGHKARYEKLYAEDKTLKSTTGFGAERKAQKALDAANEYRETYRPIIAMYENAEKYLRDVLQGRLDPKKLPTITKWKTERETLNAKMGKLYQEYSALKNEIREVEIIRKAAEQIARQIEPPKRTRAREMEL
jgi:TfoX/Sxy family transcriptional regulator of competence genes